MRLSQAFREQTSYLSMKHRRAFFTAALRNAQFRKRATKKG
jgi:hypothetical protein